MRQLTFYRMQVSFLRIGAAAVFSLALAGCGGSSSGAATESVVVPVAQAPDDLKIARAVYGLEPSIPVGFYVEAQPYPDRQTFTVHVKARDVSAAASSDNEVCSDDFSEALDWSAANAQRQGYSTSLSGNQETDWYFQFDREIASTEPAMLLNRVYKCSVVDRSMASGGLVGIVNRRPLDGSALKFLAEYLWGFSAYNNALHAALESQGADSANAFEHRIRRAEAKRFAGANNCDRIDVWDMTYSMDKTNGDVSLSETFVRDFEASYTAGVASLCSD